MNIRLYQDDTIKLRLDEISKNLNRIAPSFNFSIGQTKFSVPGFFVIFPDTYRRLAKKIDEESQKDEEVILFTAKPYDNNYFWETNEKKVILSMSGWEHLTNLSHNNGAVYFICAIIVRDLGFGESHEENTGCINDFWYDKTGVDTGMRCAFLCQDCLKKVKRRGSEKLKNLLKEIQLVFNDLSTASRSNMDICDFWDLGKRDEEFDVFLCHNSQEKDAIRDMNLRLKAHGIRTWFDEEQLPPGRLWQDLLEEQITIIKTAAVFVGESGIGPWQQIEMRSFLGEFVRRRCPVIPVILPDCREVPKLPLFLSQLTWVDFRKPKPDPLKHLLWGITGEK